MTSLDPTITRGCWLLRKSINLPEWCHWQCLQWSALLEVCPIEVKQTLLRSLWKLLRLYYLSSHSIVWSIVWVCFAFIWAGHVFIPLWRTRRVYLRPWSYHTIGHWWDGILVWWPAGHQITLWCFSTNFGHYCWDYLQSFWQGIFCFKLRVILAVCEGKCSYPYWRLYFYPCKFSLSEKSSSWGCHFYSNISHWSDVACY